MDILWSPWRFDYINRGSETPPAGCVFCEILNNSATDEDKFILKRAEFNFVLLNIYPYTSGHLMVVPYDHLASLDAAPKATTEEMMDIIRRAETAITEAYQPDGINIGMNLGKAAGAGVDGHFHMHALPRWIGDANFMTAIGQTRTLPEALTATYERLKTKF